jgi:ribosome assembly protein YihI (activator of Der GTPase)
MTTKSSADRSREFRRRLAKRGQVSGTLTVDDTTSALLRDVAQQHDQSIGSIVKAGALLVRRELARREGPAA